MLKALKLNFLWHSSCETSTKFLKIINFTWLKSNRVSKLNEVNMKYEMIWISRPEICTSNIVASRCQESRPRWSYRYTERPRKNCHVPVRVTGLFRVPPPLKYIPCLIQNAAFKAASSSHRGPRASPKTIRTFLFGVKACLEIILTLYFNYYKLRVEIVH